MEDKNIQTPHSTTYLYKWLEQAKQWRQPLENNWRLIHQLYTNNTQLPTTPYTATVNTGKVFELVETFVSYFMQALMYQDKFFDATPFVIGSQEYKEQAVELLAELIATSNFFKAMAEALRQLVMTGNCGITVRVIKDKLMFETLDIYRCWLLPSHTVEFPRFIYEYVMTEEQLYDYWRGNKNISVSFEEFQKQLRRERTNTVATANRQRAEEQVFTDSTYFVYCLYQYNCKESKYTGTWFGKHTELYTEELEPYEIPIVASINTLPNNPYGFSPLESSIGLIAELTALKSYRLTSAKLASWNMFVTDDSMLPEDMEFAPNKVFHLSSKDSLQPLQISNPSYSVSVNEEQMLMNNIYTICGLGNGVSANVARSGERVTATEIDALQKASGIRLSLLFSSLDSQLFSPLINYAARAVARQKGKKTIRVYNQSLDSYDLYEVSFKALEDFRIVLDISETKRRIESVQKLLDFVAATAQIPQATEVINYSAILEDIVRLSSLPVSDPSRYLKPPEVKEQQQVPTEGANNPLLQQLLTSMSTDPVASALATGTTTPEDALIDTAPGMSPDTGVFVAS